MDSSKLRKIVALSLISIMVFHIYGTIFTIGLHSAFANTDTYSVENTIWIEAVGLGKSKEIKIVVTESTNIQDFDNKPTIPFKAPEGSSGFEPNRSSQVFKFQNLNERQQITGVHEIGGVQLDFTNTQYGMINSYINGTSIIENTSEYYQHFNKVDQSYSVTEKIVFFEAPITYAKEYCTDNGFGFVRVINSTYTEFIDQDSLAAFQSKLIKTDWIILENDTNPLLSMNNDYSGINNPFGTKTDMETKPFPWIALIIAAVIVLTAVPIVGALVDAHRITATKELAMLQMELDAEVIINGIQAEKEIQLNLSTNKHVEEMKILDMINNGTLTYEEGSALLQMIGSDYSALLGNRSSNIADALDKYMQHVENQWEGYLNGLAVGTSWLDWINTLIILVIVGFVIYIVYALFVRRKSMNQGTNVMYFG